MNRIDITQPFYCLQDTLYGPVAVIWTANPDQPKIRRILLSRPDISARQSVKELFPDAISSVCAGINVIIGRIAAFLAGEDVRFSLDSAGLDLCSGFQQKVLRAEHAISRGRVSTYSRIAAHIGHANAARAVGTALAHNPFPIIIPCHRAVRADGTPGGYQGGSEMKRALLAMEGVRFNAQGRIVTKEFFY